MMDQTLQEQLKKVQQNKALVQQLMNSADGQRLLSLLTADGGSRLKNATAAAEKGSTAEMVHMLARVMESKEGAQLIQNIGGQLK